MAKTESDVTTTYWQEVMQKLENKLPEMKKHLEINVLILPAMMGSMITSTPIGGFQVSGRVCYGLCTI